MAPLGNWPVDLKLVTWGRSIVMDRLTEHAQTADHGSVRIGSHERVRIGERGILAHFGEYGLGQVLQVDLVYDTGIWGMTRKLGKASCS